MKTTTLFTILLIHTILIFGQKETIILPDNPNISYIGRFDMTDSQKPRIGYSGMTIHCKFSGELIKVKFNSTTSKNHYFYIIDEDKPEKINLESTSTEYTLSQNLKDTIHELKLVRLTEGSQGIDTFEGIILADNDSLVEVPKPERIFEFYGNSITCGFGNETNNPKDGFKPEQENFYYTYASYASRLFNAESIGIAKSGIGLYRNHQGAATGSADNMLTVYDHILYKDNDLIWDFKKYIPDIAFIHLGTNDARKQDRFRSDIFEDSCISLVNKLRNYYPDAYIIFLTGPTQKNEKLQSVKDAVNNVMDELNDPKFSLFSMSSQTGEFGIGGTWHPTVAQHRHNSRELAKYIENLTGWASAPYFISSSLNNNGKYINISLSKPIKPNKEIKGFKVYGDSGLIHYHSANVAEEHDSIITIKLAERIIDNQEITLDYNYGNVISVQEMELQPLFDKTVSNQVTKTTVNSAEVNNDGNLLSLGFNKSLIQVSKDNISVFINNDSLVRDSYHVKLDSTNQSKLLIFLNDEVTSTDTVAVSMPFNTITAEDSIHNDDIYKLSVNNNSTITNNPLQINNDSGLYDHHQVMIYPNPANKFLHFKFPRQSAGLGVQIKIFDLAGNEIKSLHKINSNMIDISELKSGLYVLEFVISNVNEYLKFIKK